MRGSIVKYLIRCLANSKCLINQLPQRVVTGGIFSSNSPPSTTLLPLI